MVWRNNILLGTLFTSFYFKGSTNVASNESSNQYSIVIVMLSCSFINSIGLFVENISKLLNETGKLTVKCCFS